MKTCKRLPKGFACFLSDLNKDSNTIQDGSLFSRIRGSQCFTFDFYQALKHQPNTNIPRNSNEMNVYYLFLTYRLNFIYIKVMTVSKWLWNVCSELVIGDVVHEFLF